MYIKNWNDVPIGSEVIQDTYNEVYELQIDENGDKFLIQIGWQVGDKPIPRNNIIDINFEPDCIYDQPWIKIN